MELRGWATGAGLPLLATRTHGAGRRPPDAGEQFLKLDSSWGVCYPWSAPWGPSVLSPASRGSVQRKEGKRGQCELHTPGAALGHHHTAASPHCPRRNVVPTQVRGLLVNQLAWKALQSCTLKPHGNPKGPWRPQQLTLPHQSHQIQGGTTRDTILPRPEAEGGTGGPEAQLHGVVCPGVCQGPRSLSSVCVCARWGDGCPSRAGGRGAGLKEKTPPPS